MTIQLSDDRHEIRAGTLAAQLVNAFTPGWERGRPREAADAEAAEELASALLGRRPASGEAITLARAAAELRTIFEAIDAGDLDAACEQVNRLIVTFRPTPLLRRDVGTWRLHFHGPEGGARDWVTGCVVALAELLGSPEWPRLGVCSAGRCDRVFLDRSRNAGRRFCSEACQSRAKAAAFRARHGGGGAV